MKIGQYEFTIFTGEKYISNVKMLRIPVMINDYIADVLYEIIDGVQFETFPPHTAVIERQLYFIGDLTGTEINEIRDRVSKKITDGSLREWEIHIFISSEIKHKLPQRI